MASRILDMGDVMTLIEQAERAFDAEQAAKDAEKLVEGSFTLQDFLTQMEAIAKMGSMTKLVGMLPGMGQFKEQLANFDEREVDRIKAMILSMTPGERTDPKIIDGSRRARIARGSGTQVSEVKGLIERFEQARTMMQQMARGGGMPGLPGMGGMPGSVMGGGKRAAARQRPQAVKKKGKRVSGNPAKRAAAAAQSGDDQQRPASGAEAFGFPGASKTDFELPKELKDLL
jgi:signal recognition particle subunit SRP54